MKHWFLIVWCCRVTCVCSLNIFSEPPTGLPTPPIHHPLIILAATGGCPGIWAPRFEVLRSVRLAWDFAKLLTCIRRLAISAVFKIHQRGVQWKHGVVIYMLLCTSLSYNTTPISCAPLPLHPPLMNTHRRLAISAVSAISTSKTYDFWGPGLSVWPLSMYLYISISIYLYIYIYISIYLSISLSLYKYIYIYIHIYIYIYIYISLSLYIYIYISIHLSIYPSLSLSIYIYTHISIHTQTYYYIPQSSAAPRWGIAQRAMPAPSSGRPL